MLTPYLNETARFVQNDAVSCVITQFWITSKFCFSFLQKKKKYTVPFWTTRCSFSPANAETGEKKDIFENFPTILPFSLSTPLAQKSRITHTHTYTTIPCNSHTTMPCTWTGYGEPLPRLPINTGERTELKGGGRFFEKERNTRGGKFWRRRGRPKQKERSRNRRGWKDFLKEKGRRNRERDRQFLRRKRETEREEKQIF